METKRETIIDEYLRLMTSAYRRRLEQKVINMSTDRLLRNRRSARGERMKIMQGLRK